MNVRIAGLVFLLITGASLAVHAAPIIMTMPPGGAVTGTPGETVGFGFTITNDTPYYLLFDASYFCQAGQDPAFTTCTQTIGTYQDYIANNGTEVAPMSSLSQAFNVNTMMGFGAYEISALALVNETDNGRLVATYMEYQGDPFNGGTQVSGDIEISAAASVTVVSTSAAPEPSSGMLITPGALAALLLGIRRRACCGLSGLRRP